MKKTNESASSALLLLLSLMAGAALVFLGTVTISLDVNGDHNKSVKVFVNVTNTAPYVSAISVTPYPSVTLAPGNATDVVCNATVYDFNGYQDVRVLNATFFFSQGGYNYGSPDNNNTHYTNASCGSTCSNYDGNPTNATCKCTFSVYYYAENGTWTCNVTVQDNGILLPTETPLNFTAFGADNINISTLIALNAPGSINYGNLTVTQTSTAKAINVTNLGNRPINISVLGYGGENITDGQNLSMRCPLNNISIDEERWGFDTNPTFTAANVINSSFSVTNITLHKITKLDTLANTTNATYWKMNIPRGVGGFCNGTLVFSASDSLLP